MSRLSQTYSFYIRLVVVIALYSVPEPASSGNIQDTAGISRILPPSLPVYEKKVSVGPYGNLNSPFFIRSGSNNGNFSPVYLDSLKYKASKNLITRKLFDIVVVSPTSPVQIKNTGESEAAYNNYEGKRIRNITIKRLDVFGTDIRDPESGKPDGFEKLLNNTHINTLETIIRKNLLFKSGDQVSPLLLSDNERLLRQLAYIDDARIVVIPVSEDESDILVLTKDIYSLAAEYNYGGLKKGSLSVFDKNIFGLGHEFGFIIPFDTRLSNSPGFGVHYNVNNIGKSFINFESYFLDNLKEKSYGIKVSKDLISSTTKYAGGVTILQMKTTEDLDTLPVPQLLRYNFQDYWLSRSFLVNKQSVTRIILGVRYSNNNIFNRPAIDPDSYQELQSYYMYLASAALSVQKYYKASLIYGYGRTEDIPYGGMLKLTAGNEINEFKHRLYFGTEMSFGKAFNKLGYFYTSVAVSSYFNEGSSEQGMISAQVNHFSDLFAAGRNMMRLFLNFRYTKGFNRYTNEHLLYPTENGFSGFRNDSITGIDRFALGIESVVFSPANIYGFRFAFFGFADYSFLAGEYSQPHIRNSLSSIGIGVRIRNDNLLFNTLQIRIAYYPNPPAYSRISNVVVSGEQLLRPANFDPGPPSVVTYR